MWFCVDVLCVAHWLKFHWSGQWSDQPFIFVATVAATLTQLWWPATSKRWRTQTNWWAMIFSINGLWLIHSVWFSHLAEGDCQWSFNLSQSFFVSQFVFSFSSSWLKLAGCELKCPNVFSVLDFSTLPLSFISTHSRIVFSSFGASQTLFYARVSQVRLDNVLSYVCCLASCVHMQTLFWVWKLMRCQIPCFANTNEHVEVPFGLWHMLLVLNYKDGTFDFHRFVWRGFVRMG